MTFDPLGLFRFSPPYATYTTLQVCEDSYHHFHPPGLSPPDCDSWVLGMLLAVRTLILIDHPKVLLVFSGGSVSC